MIWTLVLFLFTMWVLSKVAFPKIQEALDKRAKTIAESIEAAERQRKESDELLEEYRERLAEAREQADDIMARARKAAETAEAEATAAGKEKREELVAAAKRDIEAETRRSLEQIRKEVADLTVLATEKVTRKCARRRGPAPPGRGGAQRGRLHQPLGVGEQLMAQEAARVYAEALFEVAKEKGKLDAIRERARPVRRRRSTATASCRSSSSAPTSPRPRSVEGLKRAVTGADAGAASTSSSC